MISGLCPAHGRKVGWLEEGEWERGSEQGSPLLRHKGRFRRATELLDWRWARQAKSARASLQHRHIRRQILAPPLSCAIARRRFSFPPDSLFTYAPATVLQRTARSRRDSFLLAVCRAPSGACSDTGSPTRARPICHRFYARENHLTHLPPQYYLRKSTPGLTTVDLVVATNSDLGSRSAELLCPGSCRLIAAALALTSAST